MKYLFTIIIFCGGIALIIEAVKSKENMAGWSKRVMSLAGVFAVSYGIFSAILLAQVLPHDSVLSRLLFTVKSWTGGIVIGMVTTLFVSGEFRFKRKKS